MADTRMEDIEVSAGNLSLVLDSRFGFLRVDPIPTTEEIKVFYEEKYFPTMEATGRAPEIVRLMSGNETSKHEQNWLEKTLYADVVDAFRRRAPGKRVLDVGCGRGDLVHHLGTQGFQAEGIDLSREGVKQAQARGLHVRQTSIDSFTDQFDRTNGGYDALTLISVFSMLPDPYTSLLGLRRCLNERGIVFVRDGNQFNVLQLAAREGLNLPQWWVVIPDHLNYFKRETMGRLLEGAGFEVLDVFSDFPIEIFLLMGENYVQDRAVGARCHARRVAFEMNLAPETRRQLYRGFADQGIGRSLCFVARKQ